MTGVCLFGGAFDPPHLTHRRIAETAREALHVDRLVVMPCATHALKDPAAASGEHRLAMCRLAFAGLDGVEVRDDELRRGGRSYTVDTVRRLRAEIGMDAPLFVLIGSDNVAELDRWHDHHSLLELCSIAVFPRRGSERLDERALRGLDLRLKHKDSLLAHRLDAPADDVNSTDLRAALATGRRPAELAAEVADYALAQGLYRAAEAGG